MRGNFTCVSVRVNFICLSVRENVIDLSVRENAIDLSVRDHFIFGVGAGCILSVYRNGTPYIHTPTLRTRRPCVWPLSEQYDPQKDYGSYTIHGGELNEK